MGKNKGQGQGQGQYTAERTQERTSAHDASSMRGQSLQVLPGSAPPYPPSCPTTNHACLHQTINLRPAP